MRRTMLGADFWVTCEMKMIVWGRKLRQVCALLATSALLAFATPVLAQDDAGSYPDKPIRLIVPWGAGGDTDAIWRIVSKQWEKDLGQKIVIVNVSGGGGTIGAAQAVHAKPDGYTLLAVHDSIAMSHLMGAASFGYFDFAPVAMMTSTYDTLATSPNNPWHNMQELVDYARQHPGKVSYAASIGSTSQLEPAEIEAAAGIELNIVGNPDTAQRMKAVVGQDVDLGSVSVVAGKSYIKAGDLRMLGYYGPERSPVIPEVPTLREQGVDVVSATNRGIFAPKGTSPAIIRKLSDTLGKIAASETFQTDMDKFGTEVNYKDTAGYTAFLKHSIDEMRTALERTGLMPGKE